MSNLNLGNDQLIPRVSTSSSPPVLPTQVTHISNPDTVTNPKVTKTLYVFLVLCYLIDHMDLGVFSVASTQIETDLGITSTELGSLESSLYIGNIIGSILCPILFRIIHPKIMITTATLMNSVLLIPFCFSTNYWLLFATRALVGIFQVSFFYKFRLRVASSFKFQQQI